MKVFRALNRGDGQHVSLERDPGIAIVAPAWLLDASVCQGFVLGEPVVATEALCELHSVLQHLGFRRGFKGDDSLMEAPNDASQLPDTNPVATAFGTGAVADGTRREWWKDWGCFSFDGLVRSASWIAGLWHLSGDAPYRKR